MTSQRLSQEFFRKRWKLLRRLEWLSEQGQAEARILHEGDQYIGVLWRVALPGKPVRVLRIGKRSVEWVAESEWLEQPEEI